MKIINVVGARPNFIKIAPLIEEFRRCPKFEPILVHTGQHYDYEMSRLFFKELNIPKPDYNLEVGSGLHGWQTARVMMGFERICLREKPRLVIVFGDVNSTLASALIAAKLHIPLAHIEAGLRLYDMSIPEEVNRRLTDHIATFLFCPTKTAVNNLRKEGIANGIYDVGDIMYDTFLKNIKLAQKKSKILNKLKLKPKGYLLLTIHRPDNVDDAKKIERILEAIQESGEKAIFPMHPRTKESLESNSNAILKRYRNISFIEPVGYFDMLCLEKEAKKILTDSGGVQKEAYFAKTPCITLKIKTEWPETIKDKWNILVADDKQRIINAIKYFKPDGRQHQHFGNGKTANKVVKIIANYIK